MAFTQWILIKIPTPVLCMIFVGGSALLTTATLLLVRRLVPHHRLKQHNDVTGAVFCTVGVLYAVLLAFVVVIVWEDFDKAGTNVEKEASCLVDLYRDSVALSPDFRKELCGLLKDYTEGVINDEWKAMARGEHSLNVTETLNKLWISYSSYVPKGATEQVFFEESVRKLNELGEARRTRLMDANTGVHPILWIVLLAGGLVTMTFISFFGAESLRTQLIMAILLASLVGLILFTIAAMDYPFSGDVAINTHAFKLMLACIR